MVLGCAIAFVGILNMACTASADFPADTRRFFGIRKVTITSLT